MTRRTTFAAIFLAAICVSPVWSQRVPTGCETGPPESDHEPRTRTQVTWVRNADGKRVAVISPVKEMKVARLIFVGHPVVPLPLQDHIAKSLREHDYDDNKEGLDELLERVRDAWQEQGYFNVKVEYSGTQFLDEDSESRTVAMTVKVDGGKQYRLDEIHFGKTPTEGAGPLPSAPTVPEERWQFTAEQLRGFFPIQQGDIFDTHKIQRGLEELRKAYGARGFINFTTVPNPKIDEASDRITLLSEIEEGRQYRIGKVEVTGIDSETLRKLLQSSEIVTGNVFDLLRFEDFAKQSQSILSDFRAEDDVERRINEESSTVDLVFHVRGCDAP